MHEWRNRSPYKPDSPPILQCLLGLTEEPYLKMAGPRALPYP